MKGFARVWMMACAAAMLAGCGAQGDELREETERRRAAARGGDAEPADSAPAAPGRLPAFVLDDSTPAAAPAPAPGEPAPAPPTGEPAPGTFTPTAPEPVPAPPTAGAQEGWTAGRTVNRRRTRGITTLRDARVGVNAGFDRMVLDFGPDPVPGYRIQYVDSPVRKCGSGDATSIAGSGWLEVTINESRAHTVDGNATVQPRERRLSMPVVREMEFTCDFEGEVQIVLGVASPNRYRVTELANPARLVIDVQH